MKAKEGLVCVDRDPVSGWEMSMWVYEEHWLLVVVGLILASARPDGRGVSAVLITRTWIRRGENVDKDERDFISSASGYACARSFCEGMKGYVSHAACVGILLSLGEPYHGLQPNDQSFNPMLMLSVVPGGIHSKLALMRRTRVECSHRTSIAHDPNDGAWASYLHKL
jgi:hypothetical protein